MAIAALILFAVAAVVLPLIIVDIAELEKQRKNKGK